MKHRYLDVFVRNLIINVKNGNGNLFFVQTKYGFFRKRTNSFHIHSRINSRIMLKLNNKQILLLLNELSLHFKPHLINQENPNKFQLTLCTQPLEPYAIELKNNNSFDFIYKWYLNEK